MSKKLQKLSILKSLLNQEKEDQEPTSQDIFNSNLALPIEGPFSLSTESEKESFQDSTEQEFKIGLISMLKSLESERKPDDMNVENALYSKNQAP